jgi:cytochrome P450
VQDFNPYSRRLHADPYPTYARLLDEAPVCHNTKFGFWAISRYDDVLAALKDWRTYSSASGITVASFSGLKPMIILMDPPRQGELRKLLLKAFTPRRVTALEVRIRGIARELIAAFVGRGECEFVRDFAAPYPTTVIAELLGIDRADREQFKEWSDAIMCRLAHEGVRSDLRVLRPHHRRAPAAPRRGPRVGAGRGRGRR